MSITVTAEFQAALDNIAQGKNVLISGKAGSGKSTLLRLFLKQVEDGKKDEQDGTPIVLITAPTGVAAQNIDGFTIHKSFGFRPGMYPDAIEQRGQWNPSADVQRTLRAIDTLVIDEISMVRADLFDMIDCALRKIRANSQPFGGVQLILVGDLLQLPPVIEDRERDLYFARWETPYFFSSKVYNNLALEKITLTKIWRQTDSEFLEILNQVREGSVSEGALDSLNKLAQPDFDVPDDWITLTSRRRRVDQINDEHLELLGTKIHESDATFTGDATSSDFNGSEHLRYAVGMRVMTIINDPVGLFVNGSFGTVVTADNDTIGVKLDHNDTTVYLNRHTWNVNRPTSIGDHLGSEIAGTIRQFPIIAAWAITIHKSQGKTIPHCFIDLNGGMTTDGQFYVALSRAVDMNNLRLSAPVETRHIRASNSLVRLVRRETSPRLNVKKLVFISFDGVNFGISEHIARIHVVIMEDQKVIADFGSWINPNCDLGEFGKIHNIPPQGMVMAPELGDFWPLLLRQASGGLVIGDRLAMLERAVRHQQRGLGINLGTGYDFTDFETSLQSADVRDRCYEMITHYQNGLVPVDRGELVPPAGNDSEGAVYLPTWAPSLPMMLDQNCATDSDNAWAAMSGASLHPHDPAEVIETAELLAAWAISRGSWTAEMDADIKERASRIIPEPPELPQVKESSVNVPELLRPGTRVAFTGFRDFNGTGGSDEQLRKICAERQLEYRTNVSKTRCDVLIAKDPGSMSGKAKKAREYGKPIIAATDFESWFSDGPFLDVRDRNALVASSDLAPEKKSLSSEAQPEPQTTSGFKTDTVSVVVPVHKLDSLLVEGARVAFRGSTYIFGELKTHGEQLDRVCSTLGLVYKQAVSKTRCDALITDDVKSTDGKSGLAKRYGKPMVLSEDFRLWAENRLAAVNGSGIETSIADSPKEENEPIAREFDEIPNQKTEIFGDSAATQFTSTSPKESKPEPAAQMLRRLQRTQSSEQVETGRHRERKESEEFSLAAHSASHTTPSQDVDFNRVLASYGVTSPDTQVSMPNSTAEQKYRKAAKRTKLTAWLLLALTVLFFITIAINDVNLGAAVTAAWMLSAVLLLIFGIETMLRRRKRH